MRLKEEIKRMNKLARYPMLVEVMEVSSGFTQDVFNVNVDKKAISIEVGVDIENDIQHRLNLCLSFGNPEKYLELSFYFNLTNKENTKITSTPHSIYDREIAKKYLPQGLNKNACINKLREMLTELLKMEKPKEFVMETFENHTDTKQLDYYNNLVDIIIKNGYALLKHGVSHNKKYFWQFVASHNLSESKHWKDFTGIIKDKAYWKRHEEYVNETWKDMKPLIKAK